MKIIHYKNLDVWKECYGLAIHVYQISSDFPKTEQFGLTQQIRRAVISVISNIAEGCGRYHKRDKIQFFHIARGSLFEVESQISIAKGLHMIKDKNLAKAYAQIESSKKLLNGFIAYHKRNTPNTKH